MKRNELSSKAWVSRFWAQYNILPESIKIEFCTLAQVISKETERQKKNNDKNPEPSSVVMKEYGDFK